MAGYGIVFQRRLYGIDPEAYLRHILSVLPEWPSNRVDELLPWNVVRIFMKGDHSITAFFKVVVAFCNKITLCSLFFWIQVDF